MRRTSRPRLALVLSGLALSFALAGPAHGQATGTIRGTVRSVDARPLTGAQVSLPGTGRGTITNNAGEYMLVNVPTGDQAVRVDMIGFASEERSVNVTAGGTAVLDFELAESAIALDAVVVTGTAGETRRREVGNAVSQIDAAEVVIQPPCG